jgi:tRNA dimethylallyltransferase
VETFSSKPKIIVIYGPTASGKTALSINLAKKFNGEVISADSRQIYQGLDIGTEKITQPEMEGIKHHLIDIIAPDTVYSVTDFKRDASAVALEIIDRGKLPIIAGGTFFYVDALLGKISTPEVAPDHKLREHLEDLSTETLYAELERHDPKRAFDIDKHNKRRLVRALEIVRTLGKVPEQTTVRCPYNVLTIGIKTDKTELRERIRNRAIKAVERGLIEETADLLNKGISKDRLSEIGLEYRVVIEFLEKGINQSDMIKKLEEKNWQYAKRQLTWLKRDETIEWFERENSVAILTRVQKFLS